MKKTILIALLFFVSVMYSQSLSQFRRGDVIVAGGGCSQGFSVSYKFKPKDLESYNWVAYHFGTDKYNVYWRGKPLPKINPLKAKFYSVKDERYSYSKNKSVVSDGQTTYYYDKLIKGVDPENVFYLGRDLIRSNNNVFYKGNHLKGLKAKSFKILGYDSLFFTDGKYIYNESHRIEGVDVNSFKIRGYNKRHFDGKKFIQIADSHDKNNFYKKGKIVTPYPNWKETKMFPDSLLTDEYSVAFYRHKDGRYKVSDNDFYLTGKDLQKYNFLLKRKNKIDLSSKASSKGIIYDIRFFKNKDSKYDYSYNLDTEELDNYHTSSYFKGDGFHLSKEDFEKIKKNRRPIKILTSEVQGSKKWKEKLSYLKASKEVIDYRTSFYYYIDENKKKLIYSPYTNCYGKNRKDINLKEYDGFFIYKLESSKIKKRNGCLKKYKRNRKLISHLGLKKFEIQNNGSKNINDLEYTTIKVYCSKKEMVKVSKKYILKEWTPFYHHFNWEER